MLSLLLFIALNLLRLNSSSIALLWEEWLRWLLLGYKTLGACMSSKIISWGTSYCFSHDRHTMHLSWTMKKKFLTLHRRISRSRLTSQRYNNISNLAKLIGRFMADTKMVVRLRSVSRISGLQEFCHCLLFRPWLREQWEPIILSCTCESWSTWIEKGPSRPDFTIQKIATEQWEWSCFRHYRDSF
jgi:hypothetical protein